MHSDRLVFAERALADARGDLCAAICGLNISIGSEEAALLMQAIDSMIEVRLELHYAKAELGMNAKFDIKL